MGEGLMVHAQVIPIDGTTPENLAALSASLCYPPLSISMMCVG